MLKKPSKRILYLLFCAVFFAASVFLSTCGIEEYYYLPQISQTNISTIANTSATINLPPLTGYYYAQNYKIYYRIYISGISESGTINTSSQRNSINSSLESDYNAIFPNTNPTSTTAGIPANVLFYNRKYFELALEGVDINSLLTTSGGIVDIFFPTVSGGYPVLSISGLEYHLSRSKSLISPEPNGDMSFRNTSELSAYENANLTKNADVAARDGLSPPHYAYVSMYVVAEGMDPVAFTPVYSKPTHISIFRLPDNF